MAKAYKRTVHDKQGKARAYWVFPYGASKPQDALRDARSAQRVAQELERWHEHKTHKPKEDYQCGLHNNEEELVFLSLIQKLEPRLFQASIKPKKEVITIDDLIKWDLDRVKVTINGSESHIKSLAYTWKRIKKNLPSHCVYPSDITSIVLEDYFTERRKQGVLLQTIQYHELTPLKRILERALRKEAIDKLPEFPKRIPIKSSDIDKAQAGDKIPDADLNKLFLKLSSDQSQYATFILETGLRLYELGRMRFSWIVNNSLFLPGEVTKTRSPRIIPVTSIALEIATLRYELFGDLLFPQAGKMTLAMERASKKAELDYVITCRDLRHTFASRQTANGIPLPQVMAMMGHKSLAMTSRYVHHNEADSKPLVSSSAVPENLLKMKPLRAGHLMESARKTNTYASIVEVKASPTSCRAFPKSGVSDRAKAQENHKVTDFHMESVSKAKKGETGIQCQSIAENLLQIEPMPLPLDEGSALELLSLEDILGTP